MSIKADFGHRCIRLFPALFATIALAFTFPANFSCSLVKFEPTRSSLPTAHFGLFDYSQLSSATFDFGSNGGSLRTEGECTKYDKDDVDFDSSWKTARAFAILGTIIGCVIVLCLWLALCSPRLSQERFWTLAGINCLLVIPLSQGLTFLLLKSEICQDNPVLDLLGSLNLYEDDCQLDAGGKTNIVAIIVWFLTGLLILISGERLH